MTAVIVMATHNAGAYLEPQLRSIQNQSVDDWLLFFSDDDSGDDTAAALRRVCREDKRCHLLPQRAGASGACANFEYLLQAVAREAARYSSVFLCDQDDLWHPRKLAVQQVLLGAASGCYSDAALIDDAGNRLSATFLSSLRSPQKTDLRSLLAQNSVLGCSLALRMEVLGLALPFPEGVVNHDWWLALCAAALEGLLRSDELLLSYRQHDHNEIGAYRPMRQWKTLPALLKRQRRVLAGQRSAVQMLIQRLKERGLIAPEVLADYLVTLDAAPLSRSAALLNGPYAASHVPLRWLRAMAAFGL